MRHKLVLVLLGWAAMYSPGFIGLASAQGEWSDIQYVEGRYSRIYMDFVVVGGTGTFYVINDWMTNQADGAVLGGLKAAEYNRFEFAMSGDDYEIRVYADGHGDIFKNGSPSTLPGFVSECSWTTSPNLPTTDHTIWEFSFEVPPTVNTVVEFVGHDPVGTQTTVYTSPPMPPAGMDTGPSAFTHFVDGSFSDFIAPPILPPVPVRAAQNPNRDPHFDLYDAGVGWLVGFAPGGGVHVEARSDNIVPTLQEWGLITLSLLIVTSGVFLLLRQRRLRAV